MKRGPPAAALVSEEDLLVGQRFGDLVHGGVGERHPGILGLQPVDEVTEDPAATTAAEAVVALAAEAAAATRRDARDKHLLAEVQPQSVSRRHDGEAAHGHDRLPIAAATAAILL